MAILGLQRRFERAFKTQAAFGLLSIYPGRGLLWQRYGAEPMKDIAWRPGCRHMPSWSWLSKNGPIRYMSLQFEKVAWASKEFRGPFRRQANSVSESRSYEPPDITPLEGLARKLVGETLPYIYFDMDGDFKQDDLRCVVIGRDKLGDGTRKPRQHVLVVIRMETICGEQHERVGVASLSPEQVGSEGEWITIH